MLLQLFVLFIVQSNFSFWPIMVKSVCSNGQLNPMQLAIVKDGFGCIFLWISLWLQQGRPSLAGIISSLENKKMSDHPEIRIFLLLSLFSFLNTNAYMFSLNYVTSFNASIFHPTVPVFAAVLGVVLKVEVMTMWKIISAVLCILGSLLVVLSHDGDDHFSSSLLGNLLLLLHCSAMSGLLVFQKFLPPGYSSLHISTIYFTLGTVLTIPLCVAAVSASTGFATVSLAAWGVGIFGSFIIIIFNYTCMNWTTKTASPSLTASSMMLQPPLTFIYSSLIEGQQPITAVEIVGAIIIIIGLLCSVLSPHTPTADGAGDRVEGIALNTMHSAVSSSGSSMFGSRINYTSVNLSSPSSHGDSSIGREDSRVKFSSTEDEESSYHNTATSAATAVGAVSASGFNGSSVNKTSIVFVDDVDAEIQSISANSSSHSLYFESPDRSPASQGTTTKSGVVSSGGSSSYRRVGSSSGHLNNVSNGNGSPEGSTDSGEGGSRTSPLKSVTRNLANGSKNDD